MAAERAAFALDSFAVLAYLDGEAGMPRVRALLTEARQGRVDVFLSLINLGEVLYTVERERGLVAAQRALAALDQLPVQVLDADRPTVLAAAHLKAQYPISYADAFAVAAARAQRAVLVTGDPEFRPLAKAGLVEIDWLPRG